MKKKALSILLVLCFLSAFTYSLAHCKEDDVVEESVRDSCLIVYLEKNIESELCWDLVFKNITSDTITMLTRFKDFRGDNLVGNGFNAYIYHDRSIVAQIWDEPKIYYDIDQDGIANKRLICILPHSVVKLPFCQYNISGVAFNYPTEIGVQFEVKYTYYNKRDNSMRRVSATTNYLTLN